MLGYKWLIVYCLSVICHIELFPVKLFFFAYPAVTYLFQAYVWRFDPLHPRTLILGILVGKYVCQVS